MTTTPRPEILGFPKKIDPKQHGSMGGKPVFSGAFFDENRYAMG
jgi:hypothetical protein